MRKFHVLVVQNGISVVVQNNGKEMYKKVWCTCKFGFLPIRSIDFDAILIAVPV